MFKYDKEETMDITIDTHSNPPKVVIDGHEIDASYVRENMNVETPHGQPFIFVTLTFAADRLRHISPAGTTTTFDHGTVVVSGEDMADVMRTAGMSGEVLTERKLAETAVDLEAARRIRGQHPTFTERDGHEQ